jgi:hypothetical protein
VAAPMPLLAPVTNAIFPFTMSISFISCADLDCYWAESRADDFLAVYLRKIKKPQQSAGAFEF